MIMRDAPASAAAPIAVAKRFPRNSVAAPKKVAK
jgi:hypothetical protein